LPSLQCSILEATELERAQPGDSLSVHPCLHQSMQDHKSRYAAHHLLKQPFAKTKGPNHLGRQTLRCSQSWRHNRERNNEI